jgi:hypothetical protein
MHSIRPHDYVELLTRAVSEDGPGSSFLLLNRFDSGSEAKWQLRVARNQLGMEVSAMDGQAGAACSPEVLQIDVQ